MFPPSENSVDAFDGPSRKRKPTGIDLPGPRFESCVPWELNMQESGSHGGTLDQGSSHRVHLNLERYTEHYTSRQQFTDHGLHYQKDFSEVRPTGNNFCGSGNRLVDGASLKFPVHSLQHERPPSSTEIVTESTLPPNRQSWSHCLSGQTEAHRSSCFSESCNAGSDASQSGAKVKSLLRYSIKDSDIKDSSQQGISNLSSESVRPVENFHQGFVHFNSLSDGLSERSSSQEDYRYETPYESKESGLYLNNGTSNLQDAGRGENGIMLQNGFQGSPSGNKEQNHGGGIFRTQERAATPEMEKSRNSLTKNISSTNGTPVSKVIENNQRNNLTHAHSKVDETNKLTPGTLFSTVVEQLWDGRVQLSSSVTVSAVAFFKSGEKLPHINWSDFIEVKGKVRLEAFEKYIQDLPRSRNRGLMVISLCWKMGSSGTELTGMKEVSKGYQKGERVGYAQLTAGIDLYICPRSDTIFTILAKYGFFKGMSAIDDNQDSMIGCVVWRKNKLSSNAASKNLESKNNSLPEQHLELVSGTLTHEAAEKKLSPMQPVEQFNQSGTLVTVVSSPSPQSVAENGGEIKKIEFSAIQPEVGKTSSAASVSLTPSVPSNSSAIEVGQRISAPSGKTFYSSSGHLLGVEASHSAISGGEQSKLSLQKKNAVTSVPYNVKNSTLSTSDVDDLPEYDFGIASGLSENAYIKHVDASMLERKLPAVANWTEDGSMSSNMPAMHAISGPSQKSNDIIAARNHSALNQGMPPSKVVCERLYKNPLHHNSEENFNVQSKATKTAPVVSTLGPTKETCSAVPKKIKLFDNDDDMPEWCPPEPYKQSLGEAEKPLATLPPELPSSSFKNVCPVGPRPIILPPPPSPASIHSQFSYQPFWPAVQCATTVSSSTPQCMPIQNGGSVSTGFKCSPALRPPPSSQSMPAQNSPSSRSGFNCNPALRSESSSQPMPIQNSPSFSSGFGSTLATQPLASSLDIKPPYQYSGRGGWRP